MSDDEDAYYNQKSSQLIIDFYPGGLLLLIMGHNYGNLLASDRLYPTAWE